MAAVEVVVDEQLEVVDAVRSFQPVVLLLPALDTGVFAWRNTW